MSTIEQSYSDARDRYAAFGVDTDAALRVLDATPLSIHCWQADDVTGFEGAGSASDGGIQATGRYPGRPQHPDDVRRDLATVFSLIPGRHRLSLHAMYGELGGNKVDRDAIEFEHFGNWLEWAERHTSGVDFNSTFFAHPKAADGYTLAHDDKSIRDFWIAHGRRCRDIGARIGERMGSRCVHNIWVPDGSKDRNTDKMRRRELLKESLDSMLERSFPAALLRDSLESKLFGIGSEAFTAGSHELYLGYAIRNNLMLTLDLGHFHPTESVADKISAILLSVDELLLHISRGVRWDSDHVPILNDTLCDLMREIVWSGRLDRVAVGLDFFDASINRIGAYVIGARATQKALLAALLDPIPLIRSHEERGEHFERMFLLEEATSMPSGDVWRYYCLTKNVPVGVECMKAVNR